MATNEWTQTDWDSLKRGDHVRFEKDEVALEGKIFMGAGTLPEGELRVEIIFASPTLSWLKILNFTPYKPFVQETFPISEENKTAFYKLLGVEYP